MPKIKFKIEIFIKYFNSLTAICLSNAQIIFNKMYHHNTILNTAFDLIPQILAAYKSMIHRTQKQF